MKTICMMLCIGLALSATSTYGMFSFFYGDKQEEKQNVQKTLTQTLNEKTTLENSKKNFIYEFLKNTNIRIKPEQQDTSPKSQLATMDHVSGFQTCKGAWGPEHAYASPNLENSCIEVSANGQTYKLDYEKIGMPELQLIGSKSKLLAFYKQVGSFPTLADAFVVYDVMKKTKRKQMHKDIIRLAARSLDDSAHLAVGCFHFGEKPGNDQDTTLYAITDQAIKTIFDMPGRSDPFFNPIDKKLLALATMVIGPEKSKEDVVIWDVSQQKKLHAFTTPVDSVSPCWSQDGQQLFALSQPFLPKSFIYHLDLKSGGVTPILYKDNWLPVANGGAAGNSVLIYGPLEAKILDIRNNALITIPVPKNSRIIAAGINPTDENIIALALNDLEQKFFEEFTYHTQGIIIWDAKSRQEIKRIEFYNTLISNLAWDIDGSQLAVGQIDGNACRTVFYSKEGNEIKDQKEELK